MALCLPLLVFGLPGNWAILLLAGLWSVLSGADFGWAFFTPLIGLAFCCEALDFVMGWIAGKWFGGTGKGNVGGVVGGLLGGFAGAGFFFGLGALPGSLLGAFGGSYAVEHFYGMDRKNALRAAAGTMLGRFGGFVIKLGAGIAILYLCALRIWESAGTP
jgi:uncharacterized protein YqgC (DUF456 family)